MSIFATVVLSAIFMILEEPLSDPNSTFNHVLKDVNIVITIIFTIEMIIKIIVFGLLFNGGNSYLRNGWNTLDSFIVMVSIVSIIMENIAKGDQDYSNAADRLELIKMLRVLRSMRLISNSEGLKLSVISLIHSLPGIMRVTIVSILFYLLFGIFFLNILKGKFYHCNLNEILFEKIE